jgi:hypothetical protein
MAAVDQRYRIDTVCRLYPMRSVPLVPVWKVKQRRMEELVHHLLKECRLKRIFAKCSVPCGWGQTQQ